MNYPIQEKKEVRTIVLTTAVLLLLECLFYMDMGIGSKWIIILFAGLSALMLYIWNLKPLWNISTLLLSGYVIFSGVGMFWALSGKFFLREYSKLVIAAAFFLFVLLKPKFDRAFVRRCLTVIALLTAAISFLSVEAASTGLVAKLIHAVPSLEWTQMEFSYRLYGVFGNSNVEASLYAVGMLAGFACMEEAETNRKRFLHGMLAACNAFGFLLCISVGAVICFIPAVMVYLLAAGQRRVSALLRMFFVAGSTMLFAVASIPFFNRGGVLKVLPVLLLVADMLAAAWLDRCLTNRLTDALGKKSKVPFIAMIAAVVLAVGYVVVALNLHAPYLCTANDRNFSRSIPAIPGQHTLIVESEDRDQLWVTILTQNRPQILEGTYTELYAGQMETEVSYTVPENAELCEFRFGAAPGTKLISATEDGVRSIPMKYTLLPNFIAERVQGAWSNRSLVIRQAFWECGMRLFRLSPVIGHGYGAYETGLTRVQDFYYETKYVHNQYIQVLLESGIIGFAMYAAALLSLAGLLLKNRKFSDDETYGWVYPALASVFFMMATVTCWDISMSREMYLAIIYVFFALIIRLFAAPLPVKTQDVAAVPKKKKGTVAQKQTSHIVLHIGCAMIPVLFLLTIAGNLLAQNLIHRPAESYDQFFSNLDSAVQLDRYEYNDEKLSYVFGVKDLVEDGDREATVYLDQANVYAEELMQVQSNSIPLYLEQYYAVTGQYDKSIAAAMCSTEYSASDADTWNKTISTLWNFVVTVPDGLLTHMELMPALQEYCDALQKRDETAILTITLEETPQKMYEEMVEMCRLYAQDPSAAEARVRLFVEARLEVEQAAAAQEN